MRLPGEREVPRLRAGCEPCCAGHRVDGDAAAVQPQHREEQRHGVAGEAQPRVPGHHGRPGNHVRAVAWEHVEQGPRSPALTAREVDRDEAIADGALAVQAELGCVGVHCHRRRSGGRGQRLDERPEAAGVGRGASPERRRHCVGVGVSMPVMVN